MVEEEARDVAQVFRVDLLLLGIEFKHRHTLVAVNLVSWWTAHGATSRVLL